MKGQDLFSLDLTSDIDDILSTIDGLVAIANDVSGEPQNKPATCDMSAEALQKRGFNEPQINEVSQGLAEGLKVEIYAKDCYNWKQMREIRLGLQAGVDTEVYENPLFSVDQMKQIRLGLQDHINVTGYARLIVSATDMRKERQKLTGLAYQDCPTGYGRTICDDETGLCIRISDNYMEAYLTIPEGLERKFTVAEIEKILKRQEVNTGIQRDKIQSLLASGAKGKEIKVAQGDVPQIGRNGWYDFLFNAQLPEGPKELPDGRVDYSNVMVAEAVEQGQELAKYHPAERGKKGKTVTGIVVDGSSGKDLPRLDGTGISRNGRQYIASVKGFVFCDPAAYRLDVQSVYVVEGDVNRYNGNLVYDGTIYIKGSVSDMVNIQAKGDIIVDGFVEGGMLQAGQNVIARGGVNAGGKGEILAGGLVMGSFFEAVSVKARGSIEGNYFLNCQLETENKVIARGGKSRIMGGQASAMAGIESNAVGHYGNSGTLLDVGDVQKLDEKIYAYKKRREKVKSEVSRLEEGKHKLRNTFGNEEAETNSIFHKTCLALQQKEEELRRLGEELERLNKVHKRADRAYIRVTGEVLPGVTVRIAGETTQFQSGAYGVYMIAGNKGKNRKGVNR
jgi:uncharacterized protein (DUF342 family)